MKKYTALIFGLLLGNATTSSAVPMIHFGEDQIPGGSVLAGGNAENARNVYLAQLSGVGNEDFEGFADGTVTPLDLLFPGSTGSIGATLSGAGTVDDDPGAGRFATSGSTFFEVTGAFNITFSNPIAAFGFYGIDIGDFDGQITLQLELSGGGFVDLTVPNTTNGENGSLLFYGFIDPDNTYTGISFGNTNAGTDTFGFDDMVIGDAEQISSVPEPGVLALLGFGLLGLGMRELQKRRG